MLLTLRRYDFEPDACGGELRLNFEEGAGSQAFAWTAEDCDRGLNQSDTLDHIASVKVRGQTAIPAGCYQVVLKQSGNYGADTPTVHKVPGFRYIRIHAGNSADDTEGCILPGLHRDDGADRVTSSAKATKWLRAEIQNRIRAGESVRIHITRDPAAWSAYQQETP